MFIEFAYNDAHFDKFEMPVARGASNLDQIVHKIKEANPTTEIVLQIMNVGWDAPNGNRSCSVRANLERYNDNYRVYASQHKLPLLDHFPIWLELKTQQPDTFQICVPDGSHPTPEASLKYTWPTVKAWLENAMAEAKA